MDQVIKVLFFPKTFADISVAEVWMGKGKKLSYLESRDDVQTLIKKKKICDSMLYLAENPVNI